MNDIENEINQRIVRNPNILAGKPTIRGTRIPVHIIIDRFWNGVSEAEIVDEYPSLTVEDIRAALANILRENLPGEASA
jgi:uncharacterized protein (DUF433 family)